MYCDNRGEQKEKSLEIFKFAYFIFCDYRILILNAFSIILLKSPDFNAWTNFSGPTSGAISKNQWRMFGKHKFCRYTMQRIR